MLCYVMLCYVMLCYVMLCYVMFCYVMLCYVMLLVSSADSFSNWKFYSELHKKVKINDKIERRFAVVMTPFSSSQ